MELVCTKKIGPICTRKFNGEEYKFYREKIISWVDNSEIEYISCETPENAFGYPDTVLLGSSMSFDENGIFIGYKKVAYTLHRYLPKWILKRVENIMIKLEEDL